MSEKPPAPVARLTMITLGVSNMRASIAFYEALGFMRKFQATGEVVAFFDTGGTAIGLFPWDQLAQDVTLPGAIAIAPASHARMSPPHAEIVRAPQGVRVRVDRPPRY